MLRTVPVATAVATVAAIIAADTAAAGTTAATADTVAVTAAVLSPLLRPWPRPTTRSDVAAVAAASPPHPAPHAPDLEHSAAGGTDAARHPAQPSAVATEQHKHSTVPNDGTARHSIRVALSDTQHGTASPTAHRPPRVRRGLKTATTAEDWSLRYPIGGGPRGWRVAGSGRGDERWRIASRHCPLSERLI